MIRMLSLSLLVLLYYSCKERKSTNKKTEILEIYEAIDDGTGYIKGDLKHYESKNYENDLLTQTYYYEANGEVKGYEILDYENGRSNPKGSSYFDPNHQKLSYYTFEYEDQLKVKTNSYDASNDELLRIEAFSYEKDLRVLREIKNANGFVQRSYHFTHDGYGNEIEMAVLNAQQDTLALETYQITEYYTDNTWKEKWGFVNEVPTTYQIKK